MKDRKTLVLALQVLVSIALVAIILYMLKLESLLDILSKTDPLSLGLAVLAYLSLNVLNTVKLGMLVGSEKKLFEFKELFMINMAGMLASDVTPGRAGYFYTIVLLKDRIRQAKGAAALAVFQLTELLVKLVGALTAFFLLVSFMSGTKLPTFFFLAFGLLAILTIFILLASFSRSTTKLLSWSKKLLPSFVSFQEHAQTTKKVFASALGITLLGWLFRGMEWFFIANAVGLSLEPFQAILLHPLITMFAFVPISIAGLGLVEFAGITVITNMGVASAGTAAETVFAFLLLDRAMNVVVDLIGLKRLVGFK